MTSASSTILRFSARRFGIRRFRRDESGATVIEFGILAFPFFALSFAILEMVLLFWTTQVLEESVAQTSRSLLTGQSHGIYNGGSQSVNTDRFKTNVCANAPGLIDCTRLTIDVRPYVSFAAANAGTRGSNPVRGAGNAMNLGGFGYVQPQPNQIVVVRAVLNYRLYFNRFSSALVNVGANGHAIIASAAFKTEPYVAPTS